jgi:hypothetical protein
VADSTVDKATILTEDERVVDSGRSATVAGPTFRPIPAPGLRSAETGAGAFIPPSPNDRFGAAGPVRYKDRMTDELGPTAPLEALL